MKKKVETANAPKSVGPYSQGITANSFIFTSGQIPVAPEGNLIDGSIEEKTHQVMKNLQAILESAGTTFKNVIKTTIFLTDMADYGKVNEVYGGYMSEPFPARETVCVKELPLGARIEISMIAVKSNNTF